MNLEQINNLNIEEAEGLESFINEVNSQNNWMMKCGPSNFGLSWSETVISGDEELSFKMWILTLEKLSRYFHEKVMSETRTNYSRFFGYLKQLEIIHKESNNETILFMNNIKKWHSLLFESISDYNKTYLYALHKFVVNHLEDSMTGLVGIDEFLEKESDKMIMEVKAYIGFIKTVIKN